MWCPMYRSELFHGFHVSLSKCVCWISLIAFSTSYGKNETKENTISHLNMNRESHKGLLQSLYIKESSTTPQNYLYRPNN